MSIVSSVVFSLFFVERSRRSDDGKILHGGCETVLMMTFALVVAVMAMFFAICFCDMRANGHK